MSVWSVSSPIGSGSCLRRQMTHVLLVLVSGTFSLWASSSFAQDGWPMQGHDAQRTGRSSAPGPIVPTLKWSYDLGTRVQDNASPLVGPDGTVYVPSEESFYAINPDGTQKWVKQYVLGNSWRMRSAPALSPDGSTIYVLGGWLGQSIRALDTRNGDVLWEYSLSGENVSYSSFAVGNDGTIYIGTWKPALYAINPDGTLKWQSSGLTSPCGIEPPPAVDSNGNVYFVQNCAGLVALDSSGNRRWTNGSVGGWVAPTIGPDGTIYVDNHAFNPDGTVKWKREDIKFTRVPYLRGMAISPDGAILRASEGEVYALDSATGATRWVSTIADTADEDFGGSPALSSNGVLYVMGSRNSAGNDYIYAILASDGTLLWKHQLNTPGMFFGPQSPALGPDGTLYILSSGNLGYIVGTNLLDMVFLV